jgi:hypothetical protein
VLSTTTEKLVLTGTPAASVSLSARQKRSMLAARIISPTAGRRSRTRLNCILPLSVRR